MAVACSRMGGLHTFSHGVCVCLCVFVSGLTATEEEGLLMLWHS